VATFPLTSSLKELGPLIDEVFPRGMLDVGVFYYYLIKCV